MEAIKISFAEFVRSKSVVNLGKQTHHIRCLLLRIMYMLQIYIYIHAYSHTHTHTRKPSDNWQAHVFTTECVCHRGTGDR